MVASILVLLSVVSTAAATSSGSTTLTCDHVAGGIRVSWTPVPEAAHYDLAMGVPDEEESFAGHHADTNLTHIDVRHLVAGQTYWFQLFAHRGDEQIFNVSEKIECEAPVSLRAREDTPRRRGYFIMDVIRMHAHYESSINNRNAANALGSSYILKKRGSGQWARPLANPCLLALYHVHVKKDELKGQTTPSKAENGQYYANYMSCNDENRYDKTKVDDYHCYPIGTPDCQIFDLGDGKGSKCEKAQDVTQASVHVGLGLIAGSDSNGNKRIPAGSGEARWFSLPKAAHDKSNWKFDSQYLKAKCKQDGQMSAADVKKAFSPGHRYLSQWELDVSAFSDEPLETNKSSIVV